MQLRRTFFLGVIGSLSLAALLGIWALLFGNFGNTAAKAMLSTLTTAMFSLTLLGAAVVLERARWRVAMIATFILSGLGLMVYLPIIWFEPGWRWEWWGVTYKVMWWLAIWSIGLPHMGLLSLASFKGFYKWVRRAAIAAVFALTVTATFAALYELEPNDDYWGQALGVLGILAALGTITVPILAKVSGIDKIVGAESTAMELKLTCPRCLLEQTVMMGHSRCSGCKLKFEMNIKEPRCPGCDYLLHKLTEPVCPECGRALGVDEIIPGSAALDTQGAQDG